MKTVTHNGEDTSSIEDIEVHVEAVMVKLDSRVASGNQICHHHQDRQIAQPFFQDRQRLSQLFVHVSKPYPSAATGSGSDRPVVEGEASSGDNGSARYVIMNTTKATVREMFTETDRRCCG